MYHDAITMHGMINLSGNLYFKYLTNMALHDHSGIRTFFKA